MLQKQTEYLLSNKIDDEMRSFLLPFHVINMIWFRQVYSMRFNFIIPNRRIFKLMYTTIAIIYIILYFDCVSKFEPSDTILTSLTFYYFQVSVTQTVSLLPGVLYSDINVAIVIKLQSVMRSLKDTKDFRRSLIRNNHLIVAFYFVYVVCNEIVYFRVLNISNWQHVVGLVLGEGTNCLFDIILISLTTLVILLRSTLESWTLELKHYIESINQTQETNEKSNDLSRIVKIFILLSEAIDDAKKSSAFVVSYPSQCHKSTRISTNPCYPQARTGPWWVMARSPYV
jgi:hypothetical protein